MDVYDLPELGLEPFDITIFDGLFDHLPTPSPGLKIAADLTSELMVFDTDSPWGMEDDSLLAGSGGRRYADAERAWPEHGCPTGPAVVERDPALGRLHRHAGDALGTDRALAVAASVDDPAPTKPSRDCWTCFR